MPPKWGNVNEPHRTVAANWNVLSSALTLGFEPFKAAAEELIGAQEGTHILFHSGYGMKVLKHEEKANYPYISITWCL